MKVVVVGEGERVAQAVGSKLQEGGHHAVVIPPVASPEAAATQEVTEALTGARVLVDVSDPPWHAEEH